MKLHDGKDFIRVNKINQRTLIMKFGGAALSSPDRFQQVAALVLEKRKTYGQVVIVVSAMGKMTDELIALAKKVHPSPPKREYDMILSVGERISMSLLAMALSLQGCEALSFTGSQSGIITCGNHSEAKILEIRPKRILESLAKGKVVIVAGFQGVSIQGEITTLGRGGSDTSAVALGVALDADLIEFYKDVQGIYDADPKARPDAQHFQELDYDKALEIVRGGAKVLHERSLLLAKANGMPLYVRSFLSEEGGTRIVTKERAAGEKIFEEACP